MFLLPSPTQSQIQTALRTYILGVIPSTIEVVEGQDNRVPEPVGPDFVVFTPIRKRRLETNVDTWGDVAFTGSINGIVLIVSAVRFGTITLGATLFGVNVAPGTTITGLTAASGGVGTYQVSISQNVLSETMATGVENKLTPTEITFQVDVHGPNSADYAQAIYALWREDYGYQLLRSSGFDVASLYAEEPKQVPFLNAEQAWEYRWIVDLVLQANIVIAPPQQYADRVKVTFEEVL